MPPHVHDLQHLVRSTGLRLREQDLAPLSSWMEARARALGMTASGEYAAQLAQDSAAGRRERELLTVQFSNGETYFYRDRGQFDLLATKILPDLASRRAERRRLRLWSAGCSSGEEAYTLAMLLDELAPRLAGWELTILGTDINAAALERARRGVYGDWSFRALDPARRARYFRPHGRGWEIDARLRDMVVFRAGDLVGDAIPDRVTGLADFDLIVCRNVFIYLDAGAVARITAKFAAALGAGGFLLTGHSELFGHDTSPLRVHMYAQSAVYEKSASPAPGQTGAMTPMLAPMIAPMPPAAPPAFRPPEPAIELPAKGPCAAAPAAAPSFPGANGDTLMQSAWQSADRGMPDAAQRDCEAAIARDALDARPYFLLAQLAQERGALEEAKALLKKVIYLDTAYVPAYLELGALYAQSDDAERAQRMYRSAREALRKLPAERPVPPFAESSAAEVLAYVDRMLEEVASTVEQAPLQRLRRRA